MKLSILIPTLTERLSDLNCLLPVLHTQINELRVNRQVEILIDNRGKHITIGEKRNNLLQRATGEYICFIDDDDNVSDVYLKHLFAGINNRPDCVSLKGIMTTNGKNPEVFEHSLKYNIWRTAARNFIKYERTINHLNCIKAVIAKQFLFPEKSFGEDHVWSKALHASGLLKNEHYVEDIIYYYQYKTKK